MIILTQDKNSIYRPTGRLNTLLYTHYGLKIHTFLLNTYRHSPT